MRWKSALKTQRKGRLVWGETPFLTHPGAGSGRVGDYNAPDSWLFHGKKGGANTADRASSRTCSRAMRSWTP